MARTERENNAKLLGIREALDRQIGTPWHGNFVVTIWR